MKSITLLAFAVLAGPLACGSSIPPPQDAWAATQADVGRAQAGGAPQNPDAKLHLLLAEEDLNKAKHLIGLDNERATTLTELARVEAQLALSLARNSAAEDSARRAAMALQDAQAK